MRLLIDADTLIYGCGFSAEKMKHRVFLKGQEEWGPIHVFDYKKEAVAWMDGAEEYYLDSKRHIEPLGNALQALKTKLKGIFRTLESQNYVLFLTGKGNYRDEVATIRPYKGNRDPTHKPFWYKEMRQYLVDQWGAIVVEGYEADDAVSMEQFAAIAMEEETCIVTIDKDLNCCEGWHYNPNKKEPKYWVTKEEGIKFFYTQLLTGDGTDNIQGIPGIGPKKAAKILEGVVEEEELYRKAVDAYEDYYSLNTGYDVHKEAGFVAMQKHAMHALVENARLLWMSKVKPDDWRKPDGSTN